MTPSEIIAGDSQRLAVPHQPGHTDGNLVVHRPERRILLTGDQVLARATPNIGFRPDGLENPLEAYLAALKGLRRLPMSLAWPAHEASVRQLAHRIETIFRHHRQRLARVQALRSTPKSAYEGVLGLFGDNLTAPHLQLVMDETLAHLEYLRRAGQVKSGIGCEKA